MRNPYFPVACAIAIVLVLIPAPWHWRARNSGTLIYIFWTLVGNIIFFVDSIVWAGNLNNPAPVYCDISTKLIIGLSVGLPAASLCINHRLWTIATMKKASVSPHEKWRRHLFDLSVGIGLPIIVMTLHTIVQGHRYDIMEDVGCRPTTYSTALSFPLVMLWPILVAIVSFVYASLAIHAFLKQRRAVMAMLSTSGASIDVSRYMRLMALSMTEILIDLPLGIFILVMDLKISPLQPWISWADTHWHFFQIEYIPYEDIRQIPPLWASLNVNLWTLPVAGVLFFLYFGLGAEAIAHYKNAFRRVCKALGMSSLSKSEKVQQLSSTPPTPSSFSKLERKSSISTLGKASLASPMSQNSGWNRTSCPSLPPLPRFSTYEPPLIATTTDEQKSPSYAPCESIYSQSPHSAFSLGGQTFTPERSRFELLHDIEQGRSSLSLYESTLADSSEFHAI